MDGAHTSRDDGELRSIEADCDVSALKPSGKEENLLAVTVLTFDF